MATYQDNKTFNWEDIAAGGYSAINSALFGIPDVLVKAASSDAYEKLRKLREENKIASTVGDVAGMFAPTGGAVAGLIGKGAKLGATALKAGRLASGLGKVAKGADTVSDIIKGTKTLKGIGGGAVRGGLAAAEQALPRVLTGQQSLEEAGRGVVLGGALGAGTKAIGEGLKKVPEAVKDISKWGNKTMLQAANVDNRALRAQAKYLGLDPQEAEKFVKEAAQEVAEKKLYFGPNLDKYREEANKQWKTMATLFDKAKIKLADAADDIKANEKVQNVLSRTGGKGEAALDDLLVKVDKTKGFANKREYLNSLIFNDKTDDEVKALATVVKGTLEGAAEELSGLDITKMKGQYPVKKLLETADFREELSTKGAGLKQGSDTAAKLALGGLGVGSTQVKGVIDDPSDPDAWKRFLTATAGGALTGALSKQIGFNLAKIAMKLDPDDLTKLVEKAGKAVGVEDVQKLVTEFGAKASGVASKLEDAAIVPSKLAGATTDQVQEQEAQTTPEDKEEAKQEVNEQYLGILKNVMKQDYDLYFKEQMPYEEFETQVAQLTDNFDPLKTAAILFKDPAMRDKYVKDYSLALKLKSTDIEGVTKTPDIISNFLDPKGVAEQRKAYSDLVDSVASLITDTGNIPSQATIKQIQADLKAITDLPATPEEKKMLLLEKLSEKYGLDLGTLQTLGVV